MIFDHLGDTYWRMGRRDEAVHNWEAAIEALEDADGDVPESADVRRVRREAIMKRDAVVDGEEPPVAPLAVDGEEDETEQDE